MNENLKSWRHKWLVCALLALITAAVYFPVAQSGFINLDDPNYVSGNPLVQRGLTGTGVHWAFTTLYFNNWHPLTWLSHEADCQFFGANPMGHHLVNVAWHVANTALLFLLLLQLTARRWSSAWVALLFAIHPMHVESVAWVAERKDLLSGFFFLLTLLAYARYAQAVTSDKWRVTSDKPPAASPVTRHPLLFYWLALFSFALGLMSKPMLVTLPCILLLLDYWPLNRISGFKFQVSSFKLLLEKIPFFAMAVVSCGVTIVAQNHAMKPVTDFSLAARLGHVPVAYGWYLFKLVWPVDHSIFYMLRTQQPIEDVLGVLILLGLATGIFLGLARRQPSLIFGWLWFLVMLVPVVGFVQVGNQAYAERYTYLPYIGLFIVLVWGIPALLARWRWHRPVLWLAAVLAAVACGQLTRAQVQVWQQAETLFKQAVDADSYNEEAWALYGLQFAEHGNVEKGIECMRQATGINPLFQYAWKDLGRLLVIQGKYDEARVAFEAALAGGRRLAPEIYQNLGDLCLKTGKPREAMTNLEHSLEFEPNQPEVNFQLGNLYFADHQLEPATRHYENAIRLQPGSAEIELKLAIIHGDAGQKAEAIAHYRRVLAIEPNSAIAMNNLAWLLATAANPALRNGSEAVQLAERACQQTRNQEAFFIGTLAAAYAEVGRFDDAVKAAQKAQAMALAHGQTNVADSNGLLLKNYQSGHAYHEAAPPAR